MAQILPLPKPSRRRKKSLCRNCDRYQVLAGQRVCWPCLCLAKTPTKHAAGTPEKREVLQARAALGVELFHPRDNPAIGQIARAYTGTPPEERNISLYKRRFVARVGGGSSRQQLELGRFGTWEEAVAARRAWLASQQKAA